MAKPIISIVAGTYNRFKFLQLMLYSIRKEMQDFPHEIIIIDGGSTDGTIPWLIKQKDIILIVQHNSGQLNGKKINRKSWGYFMNLGFKCAHGKYILMVSDDCLIVPGAIINGYNLFEKKLKEGVNVGGIAFYFRSWPEQKNYQAALLSEEIMYINHGLFLSAALEKVGYIEEDVYNFYSADSDLGLKLWQEGYKIIDSPDSFIEHYTHANLKIKKLNINLEKADIKTFCKRWEDVLPGAKDGRVYSDWKEKEYVDKNCTGKKFRRIFSVRAYFLKETLRSKLREHAFLYNFYKKVKRIIKKPV